MRPLDKGLRRRAETIGSPPGSIVVPAGALPMTIHVTLYDAERHEVRRNVKADALADVVDDGRVAWIDVTGLGDKAALEKMIKLFDVPWLVMEDVLNSPQRPKVDAYGDARFVVMRMFDRAGTCDTDQLSMFVRGTVLLTFQERPGDPFQAIRDRLANKESQLRKHGVDYLLYRMVDSCVDSIFPEVQRISEVVERIELAAIDKPTEKLIRELHMLRRELRVFERTALGTRDAMNALVRDEEGFFDEATKPYVRDVFDHATQIVELSHYYATVTSDIGQFILGSLDMRMNQVMKILAGVTVVLMPLTLIAGIYGMNFKHMPEFDWPLGYVWALGLMFVVGVALTLWMRRLGWIRREPD
jgi:magnesium transporter